MVDADARGAEMTHLASPVALRVCDFYFVGLRTVAESVLGLEERGPISCVEH